MRKGDGRQPVETQMLLAFCQLRCYCILWRSLGGRQFPRCRRDRSTSMKPWQDFEEEIPAKNSQTSGKSQMLELIVNNTAVRTSTGNPSIVSERNAAIATMTAKSGETISQPQLKLRKLFERTFSPPLGRLQRWQSSAEFVRYTPLAQRQILCTA